MGSRYRGRGDEDKSVVQKCLEDISKASPSKQLALGTSAGFLTGVIIVKAGKTAAMALGGAIILLNFACEHNFIQVNWEMFNMQADNDNTGILQPTQQVVSGIIVNKRNWMEKAVIFCREYTSFTSGLVGGFLISIASQ